ncbi:TPA: hypothetical protein ACYUTL_002288 [Serratia marcescens]
MSYKSYSIEVVSINGGSNTIRFCQADDGEGRHQEEKKIDIREFDLISGLLSHIYVATTEKEKLKGFFKFTSK